MKARIRPNWDEYFMTMAVVASMRGTCDRRYVGCVIVSPDNQVICTGYNGSSPGAAHCSDAGHLMHKGHCVRTSHAEKNAIGQAAKHGKSTWGAKIYVTTHPCPGCLVDLAAAGILEVVHLEAYHEAEDSISTVLAAEAGMTITQFVGRELWKQPINR
jgi:dCMP deaminase